MLRAALQSFADNPGLTIMLAIAVGIFMAAAVALGLIIRVRRS